MTTPNPRPPVGDAEWDIIRDGVRWLTKVEHPADAITQGDAYGPRANGRTFTFYAHGFRGDPVIVVGVERRQYHELTGDFLNPITHDEFAQLRAAVSANVSVRESWNGPGCDSGSFGILAAPHPSLVQAVRNYHAQCPTHRSVFCGHDGCTWFRDGHRKMVKPVWSVIE
jgi:hypothetical protein